MQGQRRRLIYTPQLEDSSACEPGLRRVKVAGALADPSICPPVGGFFGFRDLIPDYGLYRVTVARALVDVGLYSILIKYPRTFRSTNNSVNVCRGSGEGDEVCVTMCKDSSEGDDL